MEKVTLQELAEKLGGKYWEKGNLKRVYLNKGYNTKKMTTKTFVWENENGDFLVSCKIDCPSQDWNWIKSQQEMVKQSVEESIQEALATEYHFAKKKDTNLYFDFGKLADYESVIFGELYASKETLLKELNNCAEVPEHFDFITISREKVESDIFEIENKNDDSNNG